MEKDGLTLRQSGQVRKKAAVTNKVKVVSSPPLNLYGKGV